MYFNQLIYFFMILIARSNEKKINPSLHPCNDFYDYVCSKDTRTISNLTFTSMNEELEVTKPDDNIINSNNETFLSIDKLVKLTHLMKWCTEIEVLFTGVFSHEYFGDLHSENKTVHSARFTAVGARLENLNSTMVSIFYNALQANIDILNRVDIPISKNNKFLRWVFDTLKNATNDEIQRSLISESAKKTITKGIKLSKIYFAFYDFNNVTIIEQAKRIYETEYHRLKHVLRLEDRTNPIAEKIFRLGAIDASMKHLAKYITEYDDRFLFQAIVANPTNDGFQYLNNNHITVITRNDLTQPEKAMADTIFVTTHEIMHRIYPYGSFLLNSNVTEAALQCVQREVRMLGETDSTKPTSGWFNEEVVHEDVVNILAMRVVMKMAASKSENNKQLKEALETVVGGLCKQTDRKNELIPHHNPLEISLNTAVRQYPLFNSLYRCRAGDRMFADTKDFCKPLGGSLKIEDYAVKNNGVNKNFGGFFKDLINTSKRFNFTYGVL